MLSLHRCTAFPDDLDGGGIHRSSELVNALKAVFLLGVLWDEWGIDGNITASTIACVAFVHTNSALLAMVALYRWISTHWYLFIACTRYLTSTYQGNFQRPLGRLGWKISGACPWEDMCQRYFSRYWLAVSFQVMIEAWLTRNLVLPLLHPFLDFNVSQMARDFHSGPVMTPKHSWRLVLTTPYFIYNINPTFIGLSPCNWRSCPRRCCAHISCIPWICYIVRRETITDHTLMELQDALKRFHLYHEIFWTSGIWMDGFSLPRQHSLTHYEYLIWQFGAPNGLCSLITESKHIKVVKQPWRQSNRYHVLGQMLLTNQCLDKISTSSVDFEEHGMLRGSILLSYMQYLHTWCIWYTKCLSLTEACII